MLKPELLETLVPKPCPATFQVPGHLLEQDLTLLPELVSLATDYYEIVYNDELAILGTWTAIIDCSAAQRVSLMNLAAVDGR
jgi:hypothetical protein